MQWVSFPSEGLGAVVTRMTCSLLAAAAGGGGGGGGGAAGDAAAGEDDGVASDAELISVPVVAPVVYSLLHPVAQVTTRMHTHAS